MFLAAPCIRVTKQIAGVCCLALAIILVSGQSSFAQGTQPPQQIGQGQQIPRMETLAIVNGKPVSRPQLATECLRRFGNEVLESIINKELILAECRRLNMMVTPAEVDAEIKRRADSFGMSVDRYVSLIKEKRHIDEEKFRGDIIWTELALRRLAKKDIQASPEEIARRFETEFGPKVTVQAIFLEDEQLARQIHAQAKADPDSFGQLAIKHSVDPKSAPVRGMLPPIRRYMEGGEDIEKVAFSLQPEEISQVTPSGKHFMILKCIRHFPAEPVNAAHRAETETRIEEAILQDKLRTASIDLFKNLQDRVKIVNVHNDPELSKQMPGVAALIDNGQITMQYLQEECISRYGRDVLESEINRAILEQEMQRQGVQVTEQDIYDEIGRAAKDYGFVDDKGQIDINKWLQEVTQGEKGQIEIYVADEVRPSVALRKLVENTIQVTPEDLQKSFEANFGPRVRALAIVLQDQREAQKVWQRARADLNEKHFGELAFQYSREPASRANYGVVPPIQKHGGRPTLEEEAFKLQPNELSGIIRVGENWVILYCLGHTTPVVTEFDAVKEELRKDIFDKKLRIAMTKRFADLREAAQIDNFMTGTSQSGRSRENSASSNANGQPLPFRGNQ
jgi:parvulin-like peptidyl-prolyl isomerase